LKTLLFRNFQFYFAKKIIVGVSSPVDNFFLQRFLFFSRFFFPAIIFLQRLLFSSHFFFSDYFSPAKDNGQLKTPISHFFRPVIMTGLSGRQRSPILAIFTAESSSNYYLTLISTSIRNITINGYRLITLPFFTNEAQVLDED
jgi:hypothetical protein